MSLDSQSLISSLRVGSLATPEGGSHIVEDGFAAEYKAVRSTTLTVGASPQDYQTIRLQTRVISASLMSMEPEGYSVQYKTMPALYYVCMVFDSVFR